MANNLGSLVVSLGLDAAEFTRGLSKSEYQTQKAVANIKSQFGQIAAFVGGLGLGATFVQGVRNAADYADSMGKLAQKAGVSAQAISELGYAAQLADVDNEQLAKGLRKLSIEAADGGEKLKAIGVGLVDSSGKAKTSDALFADVAERFASMPDGIEKTALAVDLFGEKIGPELIPLLNAGAAGLKDAASEATKLGRVVKDEAAASAEQFNDNLTRLSLGLQGVTQKLAGPLIESLGQSSSYFIKVANDVGIARAALVSFGAAVARTTGLDRVGQLGSESRANQNALALTVKQLETYQRMADAGVAGAAQRVAALRAQYDRLQADGQRISAALKAEAASIEDEFKPVKGASLDPPRLAGGPPSGRVPSAAARSVVAKIPDPLGDFIQGDAVQGAIRRTDEMAAMAARAIEQTRTPLERLNTEQEDLLRLKQLGYLQDQDYWRSVRESVEKYEATIKTVKADNSEAIDQAKRLGDAYSSTFERMFTEGMKVGDLLKKLAFDAINIQFLTPAAQKAGNWLGSAVSSAFGGFFADGGYLAPGKWGIAGERGPEPIFGGKTGLTIQPNGAGAGGGVVINQSINIAGNATAETVAQLNATAARIKAETLAAVPGVVLQARRTSTGFANALRGG